MNLFIIYPLIIVSLFIKLGEFGIRADKNTLDLISHGEDVIRSITSFLNTLSLENNEAPFSMVLVNKMHLKSSKSKKEISSNLFVKTPKEAQDNFWKEIMESNEPSSLNKKSLVIPGQLGILLLMVFNQIMCEASTLVKNLDKFSNEKREKYLYFLSRLYNENIQMIPQDSKLFFNVPIPALCLNKKLYGMSNADQSELASIVKRSKNYRETSFILYNCFDKKTQRIIHNFLSKVHTWDTKCSRLIKETNKISFEFLDKFHGEILEMLSLMQNLQVSGVTFRSALGKYLPKEKTQGVSNINTEKNDLGVQDVSLEDSEVAQHSKLNLKKSSKPKVETKNTIFQKTFSFMKKKPEKLVNKNYIKSITKTKAIKDSSDSSSDGESVASPFRVSPGYIEGSKTRTNDNGASKVSGYSTIDPIYDDVMSIKLPHDSDSSDNSIYEKEKYRVPYDTLTQRGGPSSYATSIDSESLEPIFGSVKPRRSKSKDVVMSIKLPHDSDSSDNSIYEKEKYREPYDTLTQRRGPSIYATSIDSESLEPIFGSVKPRRSKSKATDTNKEFQFMGKKEMEVDPLVLKRVKKMANVSPHHTDMMEELKKKF